jgi:hypothetical protein
LLDTLLSDAFRLSTPPPSTERGTKLPTHHRGAYICYIVRVFSTNRGRPAKTESDGKDRVQLNARVPEQLALRFNESASRGQRDNLVADALERFLAQQAPRTPKRKKAAIDRDTRRIDLITTEREAIELMRYHAAAILQIAAHVAAMRKGPKRASARPERHRNARTA